MIIPDGSEIFDDTPREFESDFPSLDSFASGKFQALLKKDKAPGADSFARWAAESFVKALQITERRRASFVGDLLKTQLDKIYTPATGAGGAFIKGLFASVTFPRTTDPAEIVAAMERVGFQAAMLVLASQPVYGQIAAAVVGIARKLAEVFTNWMQNRDPPTALPWAQYSRDLDEDLVKHFHDEYAGGVDWTPLYLPPFDAYPWQFARKTANDDWRIDGVIFAPVRNGQIAWNSNYGAIPNSSRILGQAQTTLAMKPHDAVLDRIMDGQGRQEPAIPWRIDVTMCGDYQPALGQMALALWKQIEKPGPEMFRVHAREIINKWQECSDNLYESGFDSLFNIMGQLKVDLPAIFLQTFGSQMLEPYILVRRTQMTWDRGFDVYPYETSDPKAQKRSWHLGLFPNSPRPNPIVHRNMWKEGAVDPDLRTPAAWFEQDLPLEGWGWPYRTKPKQDRSRLASANGILSPGQMVPGGLTWDKPSAGMRAMPWPFPELAKAEFGKLHEQMCYGPALYVRGMQQTVLGRVFNEDVKAGAFDDRVIISAYVRPDPVEVKNMPTLARYGAFHDPEIRQQCRDAREQLLHLIKTPLPGGYAHPASVKISFEDADVIDPVFANKLREAIAKAPKWKPLDKLAAPPRPDDPPPEDPGGGVAFGDLAARPDEGGGAGLAMALALAGLGGAWWMTRR